MPTDSILVFATAIAMFVVFAGIKMRGDRRPRPARSGLAAGSNRRRSF